MSHVASVCSAPIVWEARARGLDPSALTEGLPLSVADAEAPFRRIPWHAFVVFAHRAALLLGSETLEELAATATVDSVPRPLRRVLPRLRDSRPLFGLAARFWGPWVFRGTRGHCERLPDGRIREVVRILPEHAPCPEFLVGIRGTLRAMPRLLDQADAFVTLEHDGREGEYLITPPPKEARREGWLHRAGWPGSSRRPPPHRDALRELGEILAQGAGGEGESLDRAIAALLQRQCGVAGVRLAQFDEGGSPVREACAGVLGGSRVDALPLRVAGRPVGRLELWSAGEADLAPLHELAPWVALAIEHSRSIERAAQLVALLLEDLRDWEWVEQRLERLAARNERAAAPTAGATTRQAHSPRPAPGRFDLAHCLHGLEPRLHDLMGTEVQLELHCAPGLHPAVDDGEELEALLTSVVHILCDIGSEEIRIEARAAGAAAYGEAEPTAAEILVRGRGGRLDAGYEGRLQSVFELIYPGPLQTDLDLEDWSENAVGVRIHLPLRSDTQASRLQ